jgi:ElaB/YqjD/DUF883 family membrane-anchored ribosome-binding protein
MAKASRNAEETASEGLTEEFEALVADIRARGAQGLDLLRKAAGEGAADLPLPNDWEAVEKRLAAEVQGHPLRALGVAALAGLALGLLIRR